MRCEVQWKGDTDKGWGRKWFGWMLWCSLFSIRWGDRNPQPCADRSCSSYSSTHLPNSENHPGCPSHIYTDLLNPSAPHNSLIFQLCRQAAVNSLSPWKGSPTRGESSVTLPAVTAAGQAGINTWERTGSEGDTLWWGRLVKREARLRKWRADGWGIGVGERRSEVGVGGSGVGKRSTSGPKCDESQC